MAASIAKSQWDSGWSEQEAPPPKKRSRETDLRQREREASSPYTGRDILAIWLTGKIRPAAATTPLPHPPMPRTKRRRRRKKQGGGSGVLLLLISGMG